MRFGWLAERQTHRVRMARSLIGVLIALGVDAGCDRSPDAERVQTAQTASSGRQEATEPVIALATTVAAIAPSAPGVERLEPVAVPGRIVAVGDLHGDLGAAKAALALAGAVDATGKWVGKNLTVVQTGDVLDRGDDELEIYEYLGRLRGQARAAGGRIVTLSGNHELLNVEGDLRYATPGGLSDFANVDAGALGALRDRVPAPMLGRVAAFLPGGTWARRLAEQPVVALVGQSLFAHAGVLPEHVRYGLSRLNQAAASWMRGELGEPPAALTGEESPVWTRRYGSDTVDEETCRILGEVLNATSAQRMIVGHTVQYGGVTSACDGKLWRIDVGLSSYYKGGHREVLEIDGDQVRVLGH